MSNLDGLGRSARRRWAVLAWTYVGAVLCFAALVADGVMDGWVLPLVLAVVGCAIVVSGLHTLTGGDS